MRLLALRSKASAVLLLSCLLHACATAPRLSTPTGPLASAAPSIDVIELTVRDVQTAYAAGEFTAVELTRAYLDQIDRYGPRSPLHGVPVVSKDNLDYGGLVTTAGFAGFSEATGGIDMIPADDATAVARLREAGAIVLGKTNLPDFAQDGTRTKSSVAGVTLNPYDTNRAPGG